MDNLELNGFTCALNNGILQIQGSENVYISSIIDNNFMDMLHIDDHSIFSTSTTTTVQYSSTMADSLTVTSTVKATSSTKLSELSNEANHYVTVVTDGRTHTISVNSSNTVGDLLTALGGYGISGSIDPNTGKVTLTGNYGDYITGMSNSLKTALGRMVYQ